MLDASFTSLRAAVGSDRLLYVLLQHIIPALVYFAACAIFSHAERHGWWKAYQIVTKRAVDPQLAAKAWREALTSSFLVAPLIFGFAMFPLELRFNPSKMASPPPDLWTIIWHIAVANVVEDAVVYWGHRALHHPLLYARFHKKHHEFKVTTAVAATYATSFEAFFTHLLPPMVASILLQMHVVTFFLYALIYVLDSVDAHCNYALPYSPFGSARRHSFHHSHNVGTFGVKFAFWDRLCGTDEAFRKATAEAR